MYQEELEKLRHKNSKLKRIIWEHYEQFKMHLMDIKALNNELENAIFEERQRHTQIVEFYSRKVSLLETELRQIRSYIIPTQQQVYPVDLSKWKFNELEEEGKQLMDEANTIFEKNNKPLDTLRAKIQPKNMFDESLSNIEGLSSFIGKVSLSTEDLSTSKLSNNEPSSQLTESHDKRTSTTNEQSYSSYSESGTQETKKDTLTSSITNSDSDKEESEVESEDKNHSIPSQESLPSSSNEHAKESNMKSSGYSEQNESDKSKEEQSDISQTSENGYVHSETKSETPKTDSSDEIKPDSYGNNHTSINPIEAKSTDSHLSGSGPPKSVTTSDEFKKDIIGGSISSPSDMSDIVKQPRESVSMQSLDDQVTNKETPDSEPTNGTIQDFDIQQIKGSDFQSFDPYSYEYEEDENGYGEYEEEEEKD